MSRSIKDIWTDAARKAAIVATALAVAFSFAVPAGLAWADDTTESTTLNKNNPDPSTLDAGKANAKKSILNIDPRSGNKTEGTLLASLILSQPAEGTSTARSITLDQLSKYPSANGNASSDASDSSGDVSFPLYGSTAESQKETTTQGRREARKVATLYEYGYLQTYNPAVDENMGGTLEADGNKVVLTLVTVGMSLYELCSENITDALAGILKGINVVTLFDWAGGIEVPDYSKVADPDKTLGGLLRAWFESIGLDWAFMNTFRWIGFTVISFAFAILAVRIVSDMKRSKGRTATKARGYLLRMVTIVIALPVAFSITGLANEAANSMEQHGDEITNSITDDTLIDTLEFAVQKNFGFKLDSNSPSPGYDRGEATDPLSGYAPSSGYVAKLNAELSGVTGSGEYDAGEQRKNALERMRGYIRGDTSTVNDYFASVKSGDSGIAALKNGEEVSMARTDGIGATFVKPSSIGGKTETYVPAMNQTMGSASSLGAIVDLTKDTVFFESKGEADTADDNSNASTLGAEPNKNDDKYYKFLLCWNTADVNHSIVARDKPMDRDSAADLRDAIIDYVKGLSDDEWDELKDLSWGNFLVELKKHNQFKDYDLVTQSTGLGNHVASRSDLTSQSKWKFYQDKTTFDNDAYTAAKDNYDATKASVSSSFKGMKKAWYNIGSLGNGGKDDLYLDTHEYDAMDVRVVDLREPETYIYGAKLAQNVTMQSSSIYSYIFSPVDTNRSQVVNPYTGYAQYRLQEEPHVLDVQERFSEEGDSNTIDMEKAGTKKASDEAGFGAVWIANAVRHAAINMYAGTDGGNAFSTQSVAFLLQSKYGKNSKSLLYNSYQSPSSESGASTNTGANGTAFYRYVIPHADDADLAAKLAGLVMTWVTAGWASVIGLIALLTAPLFGAVWKSLRGFFRGLFKGDLFGLAEYGVYQIALYLSFIFYQAAILAGVIMMSLFSYLFGFASSVFTSTGDRINDAVGGLPVVGQGLDVFFSGIVSVIGLVCLSALIIVLLTWPVTSMKVNGRQRDVNLVTAVITLPFSLAESITANFDQYRQQLYGSRHRSGQTFGQPSSRGAKELAGNVAKGAVLAGGVAGTVGAARSVSKAAEEGALANGLSQQAARRQGLAAGARAGQAAFGGALTQASRVAGAVRSGSAMQAAGAIAGGFGQGSSAAMVGAADAVEAASGTEVGRAGAAAGASAALRDPSSRLDPQEAGRNAAGEPSRAPGTEEPNVGAGTDAAGESAPVDTEQRGMRPEGAAADGSSGTEDAARDAAAGDAGDRGQEREIPGGAGDAPGQETPPEGTATAADAGVAPGAAAAIAGQPQAQAPAEGVEAPGAPDEQDGPAQAGAVEEDERRGRGDTDAAAAEALAAGPEEPAGQAGAEPETGSEAAPQGQEGQAPEPPVPVPAAMAASPGQDQPDEHGQEGAGGVPGDVEGPEGPARPGEDGGATADAAAEALGASRKEADELGGELKDKASQARALEAEAGAAAGAAERQSDSAFKQRGEAHAKGVADAIAAAEGKQQDRDQRRSQRGGTIRQRAAKKASAAIEGVELSGKANAAGTLGAARTAAAAAPAMFKKSRESGDNVLKSTRMAINAGAAGLSQRRGNVEAERRELAESGFYDDAVEARSRKKADSEKLGALRRDGVRGGMSFAGSTLGEDTTARDRLQREAAQARAAKARGDAAASSAPRGGAPGPRGGAPDTQPRQIYMDEEQPDGSVVRKWRTLWPDGTIVDDETGRRMN